MTEPLHDLIEEMDGVGGLSRSESFELLSAKRRRITLGVLGDGPTTISLDELARAVAERESADGATRGSPSRERVATSLHHRHLPKMDDFGVLEYDPETNRVTSRRAWAADLIE